MRGNKKKKSKIMKFATFNVVVLVVNKEIFEFLK